MSATRFVSGGLKIDVKFNDRTDKYKVKLCPLFKTRGGGPRRSYAVKCETVHVGPPASGSRSVHGRRLAVDDPRALRNAAHAAISFSRDELQNEASPNRRGSGWMVRPLKRHDLIRANRAKRSR